jgi:hypothetical protein
MASTYNSLGFQKMATGENAGTWGTKTNTTLDEIKESFGYTTVAMTADRTLTIPDGSTGTYDGRAFIIECTGALGANRVLDIAVQAGDPAANIEKPFIIYNNTSTAYTLTFKVTGATGFVLTQGSTYICYHNGTDIINTGLLSSVVSDTSPQLGGNLDVNSNSIVSTSNGNIPLAPNGTGEVLIGSGSAAGDITSSGAYDLIIDTNTGTNAGNITLSNGANGDISFTNNGTGNVVFNDAAYNPETSLTDAATITWDAQAMPITKVTLTDNRTLAAPTNGAAGQFISLLVIQDAGGTNTLAWNAVFEFPSETAPTLTSTGALADLFVFRYHNSKWLQVGATLALTVA